MLASDKFEAWAIVEVMGHSRFAGFVSEQALGGCSFVRVDVPAVEACGGCEPRPAFTKLLAQGSIFAITPCDEATARRAAAGFRSKPLDLYLLPAPVDYEDDDPFDDDSVL